MAHAMELVGERWALLVVRELMLGAKRFGDIKDGSAGYQRERALASSGRARACRSGHSAQAAQARRRLGLRAHRHGRASSNRSCSSSAAGPRATRTTARICTSAVTSLILSLRTNFDRRSGRRRESHHRPASRTTSPTSRASRASKLTIEPGDSSDADAIIAGDPRDVRRRHLRRPALRRCDLDGRSGRDRRHCSGRKVPTSLYAAPCGVIVLARLTSPI